MLPNRVTLQFLFFLLLSGGVAANVFFLQSHERGFAARESATWNIAAIEAAEVGDTGSLGPAPNIAANQPSRPTSVTTSDSLSLKDLTRAVQRELQIRGYETGGRDGVAGIMTRGAIMAYEYDHGLPLTARPSQELLKAVVLGEDGKGRRAVAGKATAEAQNVIRSVQRSLAKLGYKPGGASGRLTSETARAIRAFEADQALGETGRVSGPLIARLARVSGEGRVAAAP